MSTSATPPPPPGGQPPAPAPSAQWAYPADEKGDPKKTLLRWIAIAAAGCLVLLLGLVVVATLFTRYISRKIDDAMREKASVELADLRQALEVYASTHRGAYPGTLDELVQPDAQGHTILRDERELPRDPWGRDYVYEPAAPARAKPRLFTLGRDGKPGGSGADEDLFAAEPSEDR